jgi:hypothetical protein
MIAFDLECSLGHQFEGWFENHNSYEEQCRKGMISCPYCNDTRVKKILSPVRVKVGSASLTESSGQNIDYSSLKREIVEYIQSNFEDLGHEFTKEALKMHYGVSKKRNIRGTASEDEEKLLEDEGIQVFRFPIMDDNKDKKN